MPAAPQWSAVKKSEKGKSQKPEKGPTGGAGAMEGVVLDGLPYIDTEYADPTIRSQVDKLVEREMKAFQPPDYLAELPMPSTRGTSAVLRDVLERKAPPVRAPFDSARYAVAPPSKSAAKDPEQWRAALDRARIQLEYESTRAVNLELSKRYGANAWKGFTGLLADMDRSANAGLEQAKAQSNDVNRKRKASQLTVAPSLQNAHRKWAQYVARNNELHAVCTQLEKQVEKARKTLNGGRQEMKS